MSFVTHSPQETQKIAYNLAPQFKTRGGVIALSGELGAGKTTFTQGFAKGLGIREKIISPTFIIIRHYQIPNSPKLFFHVDLYRLEKHPDISTLGLNQIMQDPQAVALIEWADRLTPGQRAKATQITIKKISETTREILVAE